MSFFEKDFLERVKWPKTPTQTQEAVKQSESAPEQRPDTVEELARKSRVAGHTGPLVLGPSRSSLKDSWHDDARILEELYPEDFGPPRNQQSEIDAPPEPQPLAPSPPPMEPLPSSFWWSLLFGNRDSVISATDVARAISLVGGELGTDLDVIEFTESIRVKTLSKVLDERFGAGAWPAMNNLWRSAPASPGAPTPNEEQSHCSPGVKDCPRSMPAWRREFHQEISNEQRLLESMGGWCG